MNTNNLTYSIQQVSEITGLSKQVIRKWEERYYFIQPQRLENGYRIYCESDINTILKIKALVDQGHTIKQAASLILHEPQEINEEWKKDIIKEDLNDYVLELLKDGTSCNETGMNLILQQAYHQRGLEFFIESVVIPFLREVGARWENGQWGEYQEALASLTVRDYLVELRRNFKYRDHAPTIMGACLPYEQHEVPVLLLLLKAMLKGWKTILIGASPAEGSIERAVKKMAPEKVILSATTTYPFEKNPQLIDNIDKFASECTNTHFYVGGPGAEKYVSNHPLCSIQYAHSLEEVLGK